MMPTYIVRLAIIRHGATVGSTCDEVEADSVLDAERQAIDAWRVERPDCTFRVLLTTTA